MPTKREREYYRMGFFDGMKAGQGIEGVDYAEPESIRKGIKRTVKRKLSAWQKFVKANSKKPRFVLRSGKLNLKKMGVAYRKTPAGKKSKRR